MEVQNKVLKLFHNLEDEQSFNFYQEKTRKNLFIYRILKRKVFI